jgi:hypothetical protein
MALNLRSISGIELHSAEKKLFKAIEILVNETSTTEYDVIEFLRNRTINSAVCKEFFIDLALDFSPSKKLDDTVFQKAFDMNVAVQNVIFDDLQKKMFELKNNQHMLSATFFISLLLPADKSEDIIENMYENFLIWIKRYGVKRARLIFYKQSVGVILSHWWRSLKGTGLAIIGVLGFKSISS